MVMGWFWSLVWSGFGLGLWICLFFYCGWLLVNSYIISLSLRLIINLCFLWFHKVSYPFKMGFVSKHGFLAATNFVVRINAVVYSTRLTIKGETCLLWSNSKLNMSIGYEVQVKKIFEDFWRDFFISEKDIHIPGLFKRWLSKAHLRPRWKVSRKITYFLYLKYNILQLDCGQKAWNQMIEKCLGRLNLISRLNFFISWNILLHC